VENFVFPSGKKGAIREVDMYQEWGEIKGVIVKGKKSCFYSSERGEHGVPKKKKERT